MLAKFLFHIVMLVCFASCASVNTKVMPRKIAKFGSVDVMVDYSGQICYFDASGPSLSTHTNSPEEFRRVLNKALSWHNESKDNSATFGKVVESFNTHSISFSYGKNNPSEKSILLLMFSGAGPASVNFPYGNASGSGTVKISEIPEILQSVSDEKIQDALLSMKKEIDAADSLK